MGRLFLSFVLILISTSAQPENELLPADKAFAFKAIVVDKDILLEWDIAEGYYLYKEKIIVSSDFSSQLGAAKFPDAEIKDDEFFGKIGTYRDSVIVAVPVLEGNAKSIILSVTFQGCADLGVCYPPITKSVALDISSAYPSMLPGSKPTKALGSSLSTVVVDSDPYSEPLPADEAFSLSVVAIDSSTLLATWDIHNDYYLYHDKFFIDVEGAEFGEIDFPKGKIKDDDFFGKVEIHKGTFEVEIPLTNITKRQITFVAKYQGCWVGGVCYPPQEKTFELLMPPGTIDSNSFSGLENKADKGFSLSDAPEQVELSDTDKIAALLQQDNVLWVLASFFGFGLLLSLTPCVFPMIPILSGIIVGQKEEVSTRKGLVMSVVFVLSMSITYSFAGVLAGYFGENLQALFQTTWVLVLFSLVFVALAFSMFGYYDIQLPKKLQNKIAGISNNQESGQLLGVAIMGFLSALIVGPCVAPPLAGALIYIGQTGDALLGGMSLFVMSLGMGAPLLAVGAGVTRLPRAGVWMDNIKHVFGILMLAVAIYLLERIIPSNATLVLWAILLTVSPIAMGVLDSTNATSTPWRRIFKALGLIVLGYGVLIWMLVARGGGDMMRPLSGWGVSSTQTEQVHIKFEKIKTVSDLNQFLDKSKNNTQLVMLDFYADWCIYCKGIEKRVFQNPQVVNAMKGVIALQADITDQDADDIELTSTLRVPNPPVILFFNNGIEVRSMRIVGDINAQDFLQNLEKI
ncbi:MAG TPA: protein-disulfide reductase DsbD [Candidatus Thioglobus sp.]|nr:protein-disulfide reductase DsbD [Candidatus Thioglobus sp.]HIL43314.1 protein-disulfide reductase DsbD [Gammaproteobacteria bacterium]